MSSFWLGEKQMNLILMEISSLGVTNLLVYKGQA